MSAQLFLEFTNSASLSRSSRYVLTAGSLTVLSLAISACRWHRIQQTIGRAFF